LTFVVKRRQLLVALVLAVVLLFKGILILDVWGRGGIGLIVRSLLGGHRQQWLLFFITYLDFRGFSLDEGGLLLALTCLLSDTGVVDGAVWLGKYLTP